MLKMGKNNIFADMGFAEVGFADMGFAEVGFAEVGFAEVGKSQSNHHWNFRKTKNQHWKIFVGLQRACKRREGGRERRKM